MRSGFGGIVLALIAVVILAAIGTSIYRAGVAQGLAEAGRLPAPGVGAVPYPYYGPWYHGPFGFGFLFPLLFFFLIFALFRGLFWGRHWGGLNGWVSSRGPWKSEVPPPFEEWHRRAHESMREGGQKV
jgi:hypothetical protein